MTSLAMLPMYDWPEGQEEVDSFYRALRERVGDLPESLTRPDSDEALAAAFRDPQLFLAQTCWGPLKAGLLDHLHVLAQPSYGDVPGGSGAFYRSAIVMRTGKACPAPSAEFWGVVFAAPMADGLRPAINDRLSLSGCIAPTEDLNEPGFAERALVTGSHRASVRAVASGEADFAAIDCRSWAMALVHEPAARTLVVTGWTALRPGLPYVTSHQTPDGLRGRLTDALLSLGALPALATS